MKPAAGSTAIDAMSRRDDPRYNHLAGLAGLAGLAAPGSAEAERPAHRAHSWRRTAPASPKARSPTGTSIARAHGRVSVSSRIPPALTPSSRTRRTRAVVFGRAATTSTAAAI